MGPKPKARPAERRALTSMSYEILLALADGKRHGYGILKDIEARSGVGAVPSTGALYLALQRLEQDGLIEGKAGRVEDDARRRHYALTERGRSAAEGETVRLAQLVGAAHERRLIGTRRLAKLVPGGSHGR
jgi:DNA-binding PadR family transcriptional regulator